MSRQVLPIIYLNMTSEMCNILECRLSTTKLTVLEINMILSDITFAMFDKDFMRGLFQPRDHFSEAMLRQLFRRAAHTGKICIDERNMDALYDLMIAMFKSRLLDCDEAEKILSITRQHLDMIRHRTHNLEEQLQVDYAINLFRRTFSSMNRVELNLVRQTAINLFQGCKIEADLLIEYGPQGFYIRFHRPLMRTLNHPGTAIDRKTGRAKAEATLFASRDEAMVQEEGGESSKSMHTLVTDDKKPEKNENTQTLKTDFQIDLEFRGTNEGTESAAGGEAIGVPIEFVSKRDQRWKTTLIVPDEEKRICGFRWIWWKFFKLEVSKSYSRAMT